MRLSCGTAFGIIIATAGCSGGTSATGGEGTASAGSAIAMTRDGKVGETYGSAGPRRCADKKAPASGPPSREQAAAYSVCGLEHEFSDNLYLVDNLVVTDIGKPRDYSRRDDINKAGIDLSRPVYAIRGRYDHYQCRYLSSLDMGPKYKRGTNCNKWHYPNATGECWVDSFGDWQCSMSDLSVRTKESDEAPPPA